MSSYPPPPPPPGPVQDVGRKIDEAMKTIEAGIRQASAYVNDNVVPQVRSDSIVAMRTLADTLREFADRLDKQHAAAAQKQDPKA
jgi:hypothetical protein